MYLYGIASKTVPESVDVELLSDVVDAVAVLEGQVELVVGVQHIETVPIRSKHLTFKLLKMEMPKNPYFSNNAQFIMLNESCYTWGIYVFHRFRKCRHLYTP